MTKLPLNRTVELNPAKVVTVRAVGEFAYQDALTRTPSGIFTAELIPETNNLYDPDAISVRYNGEVIAYIPRNRTRSYWQAAAKVITSGAIPTVKAQHFKYADNTHEIKLFLLGSENALPAEYRNTPNVKPSQLPGYYQERTPNPRTTISSAKPPVSRLQNANTRSLAEQTEAYSRTQVSPATWLPDSPDAGHEQPATPQQRMSPWAVIGCALIFLVLVLILI